MPKYKLADYRYGREEMLALYIKENKVPEELQDKEFAAILQEEPLQPLALVPLTEEEQRNFSMSVNSVAVLRLMGKGGGAAPAGVSRGRGSTRSRGRGRGESGFYQRSPEEPEGAFGRGAREIHRSQSWDDRGERRFEKLTRRDGTRAPFEEGAAPPRKEYARSDSNNWRTLREEQEEEEEGGGGAGPTPTGAAAGGSWRLSGARRESERWRSASPEARPLRPLGGAPEGRRRNSTNFREREEERGGSGGTGASDSSRHKRRAARVVAWMTKDEGDGTTSTISGAFNAPQGASPPGEDERGPEGKDDIGEPGCEEAPKKRKQRKMVASLQESSMDEERFTQAIQRRATTSRRPVPLSHEACHECSDKGPPQGEIQGPFTTQEMAEWFQAGYFTMSLLVKRGCDEGFQPLGEVIKMWGRVPFAPGPSPPPLLGNLDQERLKKQQELAAAALYQQLQHQQFLQVINRPQFAQCALQQKLAAGDLTQQQLTAFLQQLQALKPRAGEQNLIPAMNRSMSVPDTGSLWDAHTSASQPAGGEASLWDLPITTSTQGPILEQLQLQQKLQERRDAELRAKREEEERKRREEKRRQEEQKRREEEELYRRKQCRQQELVLKLLQQSQAQSAAPWGGLAKPPGGMKALLELQESERQLQKQQRVQQRVHGGLGMSSPSQWGADSSLLWSHEKNSLWDESGKNLRSLGLKSSRSSPSLGDSYGGPGRQSRKKTDEEEKLLKLLQGIHKPQDGFTQWCEQMLHVLNSSSNLDVPTVVAFLKDMESPYDVHDFIRSYLGDTVEAKEFAKQFLERRAKQKASQQRQQQQEASWLSSGNLPSPFPANHGTKQPPFEGSQPVKIKRRPVMLHADPSILGTGGPGHLDSLLSPECALRKDEEAVLGPPFRLPPPLGKRRAPGLVGGQLKGRIALGIGAPG
ncbi:LOW QUALITY PROTEIN: GRB10-interacting GYF protein 1 [Chelonoidis abingdonii]|uniref:LOW QUALITY PROTEIN: GRB10-interacting GYF protein 1 n=1 Tax=Chelonoidis abingdonii TaxID=106734 RepID=UPI003F49331F